MLTAFIPSKIFYDILRCRLRQGSLNFKGERLLSTFLYISEYLKTPANIHIVYCCLHLIFSEISVHLSCNSMQFAL